MNKSVWWDIRMNWNSSIFGFASKYLRETKTFFLFCFFLRKKRCKNKKQYMDIVYNCFVFYDVHEHWISWKSTAVHRSIMLRNTGLNKCRTSKCYWRLWTSGLNERRTLRMCMNIVMNGLYWLSRDDQDIVIVSCIFFFFFWVQETFVNTAKSF